MRDLIIIICFCSLFAATNNTVGINFCCYVRAYRWGEKLKRFDNFFLQSNYLTNQVLLLFMIIVTVLYQKRFKRERKLRSKMQEQIESELKKRNQIEEILKASGAPQEALRILAGKSADILNFLSLRRRRWVEISL